MADTITGMIQIRTVKQYFNEFIVKGLEDIENPQAFDILAIKQKILKAFQEELYGQLIFKLGPEVAEMQPDDLSDMEGVQNILQQTFRRWRRLCILCTEQGLGKFFHLEDLQEALKDSHKPAEVILPDTEEDVTDKLDEILPEGEEPVYLNGGLCVEGEVCENAFNGKTTTAQSV